MHRLISISVAVGLGFGLVGCLAQEPGDEVDTDSVEQDSTATTNGCPTEKGVYNPYTLSGSPSGPVSSIPWKGNSQSYPNGDENFSGYGTALPTSVECSSAKSKHDHLDVTAGCLSAVSLGSYTRGQIHAESDDAFRTVALGHVSGNPAPAKWTDMGEEYRFYYSGTHGTANNPGWKAFLRYRDENNLYVASWRVDGVAQIQKKRCGTYTPLVVDKNYGAPSKNAWHTLTFTAVGDELQLIVDGDVAVTAHDSTFSWGTAGIRADAMDGAYLDDWQVFAP